MILARRDLWIVLNAVAIVMMTAGWMGLDLPPGQPVAVIWAGRLLTDVVFAAGIVSSVASSQGPQPIRLLPQTQLLLWGWALWPSSLPRMSLPWLEPTRNFWIGMFVMLTIGFHKGFVWLWHQLADRLGKNQT
jgi:hypothetical protein